MNIRVRCVDDDGCYHDTDYDSDRDYYAIEGNIYSVVGMNKDFITIVGEDDEEYELDRERFVTVIKNRPKEVL